MTQSPTIAFLVALTLVCFVPTGPTQAEPVQAETAAKLPTGEQVLDDYVKATGGKEAYAKIRSRHVAGTFEIKGMGLKGPLAMWLAEGGKMRLEIEVEGMGKMMQGADGEIVWDYNAMTGPRILAGAERAMMLRTAALDSDVNWRKYFSKATCLGVETVEGHEAYKVVLTPNQGKEQTTYFDTKTGLMVKTVMTVQTQMGDLPSESWVSDYREVDGILFPMQARQKAMNMEQVMSMQTVEHNIEIPAEKFEPPAEVRALLEKTAP